MKLDRNNGAGKYAVINLRRVGALPFGKQVIVKSMLDDLVEHGVLEYGEPGSAEEFFVLKLKDKYAGPTLRSYASQVMADGDPEYGKDVWELSETAENHPGKKAPD